MEIKALGNKLENKFKQSKFEVTKSGRGSSCGNYTWYPDERSKQRALRCVPPVGSAASTVPVIILRVDAQLGPNFSSCLVASAATHHAEVKLFQTFTFSCDNWFMLAVDTARLVQLLVAAGPDKVFRHL